MMELGDLAELLIAKCAQKKYYMQWHQWAWLLGGGGQYVGISTCWCWLGWCSFEKQGEGDYFSLMGQGR